MSLLLDERQRAMLAEMGVRVFAPQPQSGLVAPPEPPPSFTTVAAPAFAPVRTATPTASSVARRVDPIALAARAGDIDRMAWDELAKAAAACRACNLCSGRRNAVFGVGDLQPDWLIVGEAPGDSEDLLGEPFAGAPGQLLDNMLKAVGLNRQRKVFLTNVVKCRSPGDRNPQPDEVAQCEPFLRRQVQLLQPGIILAMGRLAVQSLLGSTEPIGKLRGRSHDYLGVPVVVTYHPAYLLRNLPDKAKAWEDLCLALDVLRRQASQ
jgi:uracil-DNA glycosylase